MLPEWNQGLKSQITVRHLMSHTSCLQANRTTEEIYRSPDFVQLALCAELVDHPGERFFYNNKAVNILSRIIQRASGVSLDEFCKEHLFEPLEIIEFGWQLDKAGNPHAMAGLSLRGEDLLKFGLLMLANGNWKGHQLIREDLIQATINQGQTHNELSGLLWWRIFDRTEFYFDQNILSLYLRAGISRVLVDRLSAIVGLKKSLVDYQSVVTTCLGGNEAYGIFVNELNSKHLPLRRLVPHNLIGFKATGYLGQALVVLPQQSLVGLRQVHGETARENENKELPDLEFSLCSAAENHLAYTK